MSSSFSSLFPQFVYPSLSSNSISFCTFRTVRPACVFQFIVSLRLGLRLLRLLRTPRLADRLGALAQDELDVRRVRHVRRDAAVRAVLPATQLGRTLGRKVVDVEAVQVELLQLRGRLRVLDEVKKDLAAASRPAALGAVLLVCAKKKKETTV